MSLNGYLRTLNSAAAQSQGKTVSSLLSLRGAHVDSIAANTRDSRACRRQFLL